MKKFTLTLLALGSWLLALTAQVANTDTTDTGVLINGVVWATRNVDAPGKFAQNPEDIGMIYQYNIRVGWRYAQQYADILGTDGSTVWNTTPSYSPVWEEENDPCPTGWRVPTPTEMQSLIDAGSYLEYGSIPNGCSWCPICRVYGSNVYGEVDNTISLTLRGTANYQTGIGSYNSQGNLYWCNSASYIDKERDFITCYILYTNHTLSYVTYIGDAISTAGALVRCVKKDIESECISTLSVFSNNNDLGKVQGIDIDNHQMIISTPNTSSTTFCGVVELTAIPKENAVFTGWSDGMPYLVNPRNVVITTDTIIVANFTTAGASIENILSDNLKIFPNPATSELIISYGFSSNNEQLIINNVEVLELTGRIVGTYCIRPNENSNATINVSDLFQGIYLLKINTDKGIVVEKFIKK